VYKDDNLEVANFAYALEATCPRLKQRSIHFEDLGKGNKFPPPSKVQAPVLELKKAIGRTIANLREISPSLCMQRILMEDNCKPVVENQRRLNPNMKEVVRDGVLKWLDTGIIYHISDSSWISPM